MAGSSTGERTQPGPCQRLLSCPRPTVGTAAGLTAAVPLQAGAADLVTADDVGTLCVWRAGEAFALLTRIPAFG